jgi:AraC family transcriptional regulator
MSQSIQRSQLPMQKAVAASATHPCNISDKYLVKRQSIHNGALIVEHLITPPDELEIPALTHHHLVLQLSPGNMRQVNRYDNKEYDGECPVGSFMLASAGVPIFWHWEHTDEALSFVLSPASLQHTALETDCLNPEKVELLNLPFAHDPYIQSLGLALLREMRSDQLGGRLCSESLANLFMVHLLRHYCAFELKLPQYQGGLSTRKLQQAIDYIQAHLAEDISLEAIATELGMSRYYFCRLFKQSTGISPHQYVIKCRIDRAKELLLQGHNSIIDVAFQVGFSSQSHFTKHFKRLVGVTPKQIAN